MNKRPMRIGRDGTGGPGAANGIQGGQADEAPLGDGLLILLLMTGVMIVWKMKYLHQIICVSLRLTGRMKSGSRKM